jgi:glutathione S-transferase
LAARPIPVTLGIVRAKIYVIPGSTSSMAGRLMLEHKGIPYRRRDLVAIVSRPMLRLAGFDGITVPAIKLDGERLQRTTTISRALDERVPEPPLFPADPGRRTAVEQAEAWGDEVLQPVPRRLAWAGLSRERSGVRSFLEGAHLGMPTGLAARTSGPIVASAKRSYGATDDTVRADLAALPGLLDRVDELIGEGVIGGVARNAADYQIATCVRLLLAFDDLRDGIDARPAGRLAREVVPDYPGRVPPAFPADWLVGVS